MALTDISKDLQVALAKVAATKADAEKAQATLDAARDAWQAAIETARDLHATFQQEVASLVPGVKV